MTNRLYISNLSAKATEKQLFDLFATIGTVTTVLIPTDHQTGIRKKYGFVEMETIEAAQAAVVSLNGHLLNGRPLKITEIQDAVANNTMHSTAGGYRQQKRGGWRSSGEAR